MNAQRLIDAYLDNEITPGELAELEVWIQADPEHARQFAQRGILHSAIDEQMRHAPVVSRGRRSWLHSTWQWFVQPTPTSLAVSGLVVASLLLALAMWTVPEFRADHVRRPVAPKILAQVTATRSAMWSSESAVTAPRVALDAGDVVCLDAGWAEIAFGDGAVVLLEGPAQFEIESAGAGNLLHGKLTARVPAEAVGFAIHTPLARVVDLGTEFGVSVDREGATRVSVFQGKVKLSAGESQRQLVAGSSAHVRQADGRISLSTEASDESDFIRMLPAPLELHDVLALDFNDRQAIGAETTEAGFEEFVLGASGTQHARTFGPLRVVLSVTGDVLDDRRRNTPTPQYRFTESELLRDFVFGPQATGEAVEVRIEGLKPEQLYQLTLWSFDTGTRGRDSTSQWSVGGRVIRAAYRFDGANLPVTNADYRIVATCLSDAQGRLVIAGKQVEPAVGYAVFLNGLRIRELARPGGRDKPDQANHSTAKTPTR